MNLLSMSSKTFHHLYLNMTENFPSALHCIEITSIFSSKFLLEISFSKTFLLSNFQKMLLVFLYTRLNVSLSKSKNVWLRSASLNSSDVLILFAKR